MKRLKIILKSNLFYLLLIVLVCFVILINRFIINHSSDFLGNETSIYGKVIEINNDKDSLNLLLKSFDNITAYKYHDNEVINIELGDYVLLKGNIEQIDNTTNPNIFNYKKYMFYKKQFYTFKIDSYQVIKKNNNILYFLKDKLLNNINNNKTGSYIKAFLFGNNNIDEDIQKKYQLIGISHLFATSGMHISLFVSIIYKLLNLIKTKDYIKQIIVINIVLFFMYLTSFTASILRSGTFFILLTLNKLLKINLNTIKVFIISISIIILFDPFIIFNVGFLYSFSISLSLILCSKILNSKYYIVKLFKTSFISFVVSIPITLYNFYQINVFTVLYNIVLVPLVSLIIFPLSIICYIFPLVQPLLNWFINILEYFSILFSKIKSVFIFGKPSILVCFFYYMLIILFIIKRKYKTLVPLLVLLIIHYNFNFLFPSTYMIVLDVKQGDSMLLHHVNKSILIDTGGNFYNSNISNNVLIPVVKSLGLKKIDYLILTHGDYDHMGEAIKLVENFKVEKVIFNCGEFNKLEQDLIEVLVKKKIPYYSCIKELNIDHNKLYFLNNKDYGNENDNSSVIYTELNNHKFLFMGDAGVEVEEDLIGKYNLQDIDVLKVGHHGSKTSSSKSFIDEINPKYSIISVGKNNRYGHPNDSVLDILGDSEIYRTDKDGSILFKVKNNKLQIAICPP